MIGHRPTHSEDGTPVQQSLTIDPRDYRSMNVSRLMVGVVLTVYPADNPDNRTAQQREDRRGIAHACDVLVLNDGSSTYMTVKNVVIPPEGASGLDDYYEKLPRATSFLVSGEDFNSQLQQIDPAELDGDWCVIGYAGGLIDSPFILKYWPHPANTFDPASSGEGLEGDTLEQSGRYFRRINGVEHVITSKGDIILSTTYASSKLVPGKDPKLGRFARDLDKDKGGSIRVFVKPSQAFELVFDEQTDGIGVYDAAEPELPQTNPNKETPKAPEKEKTYVLVDEDHIQIQCPGTPSIHAQEDINLKAEADTLITVGTDFVVKADSSIVLEAPSIKHGENAVEPILLGDKMQTWMGSFIVDSPFGPLPANAAYVLTLTAQVGSTKNTVE